MPRFSQGHTKFPGSRSVGQRRINDITRGKIDRFSIDTLVAMLGHAGISVQLTTRRKRRVA